MPKVNLLIDGKKYRGLSMLLFGAKEYEGHSITDIARMMGVSEPTALKYLREPERAPLESLCILRKKLNIPIEQFRECIPN